jgi:hypothetical protein
MDETVRCPGCQAQLTLPSLPAGQTVQCPRCRQVFEPARQRARSTAAPSPPSGTAREIIDDFDDDTRDDARLFGRPEPLRGERKAAIAVLMLAVSVLWYGVQFYVNYEQKQWNELHREVLGGGQFLGIRGPQDPRIEELRRKLANWERFTVIANILHHVIYWPTMVFFLIWFHQAYRNLTSLQAKGLCDIPFLATASFFVPILNFFRPYILVQEIWRASDPRFTSHPDSWKDSPRALSARFWWFFFLAASVFSVICFLASPFGQGMPEDTSYASRMACVSNFCMIAAGALLIFIIRKITQRQRERYANLYGVAT